MALSGKSQSWLFFYPCFCSLSPRQCAGLLEAWYAGKEFQDQRGETDTVCAVLEENMQCRRPLDNILSVIKVTSRHFGGMLINPRLQ